MDEKTEESGSETSSIKEENFSDTGEENLSDTEDDVKVSVETTKKHGRFKSLTFAQLTLSKKTTFKGKKIADDIDFTDENYEKSLFDDGDIVSKETAPIDFNYESERTQGLQEILGKYKKTGQLRNPGYLYNTEIVGCDDPKVISVASTKGNPARVYWCLKAKPEDTLNFVNNALYVTMPRDKDGNIVRGKKSPLRSALLKEDSTDVEFHIVCQSCPKEGFYYLDLDKMVPEVDSSGAVAMVGIFAAQGFSPERSFGGEGFLPYNYGINLITDKSKLEETLKNETNIESSEVDNIIKNIKTISSLDRDTLKTFSTETKKVMYEASTEIPGLTFKDSDNSQAKSFYSFMFRDKTKILTFHILIPGDYQDLDAKQLSYRDRSTDEVSFVIGKKTDILDVAHETLMKWGTTTEGAVGAFHDLAMLLGLDPKDFITDKD